MSSDAPGVQPLPYPPVDDDSDSGAEDGLPEEGDDRAQLLRNITEHMDMLEQLVEGGTIPEKAYLDLCNVLKIGVNASKAQESASSESVGRARVLMDDIQETIFAERANYEAQLASATRRIDELDDKVHDLHKRRDQYAKRALTLEKLLKDKKVSAAEITQAYDSAGILQFVQEADERRKRRRRNAAEASSVAVHQEHSSQEPSPVRRSSPAIVELSDDE